MNAKTWNSLKDKVMTVHGPNIDWWDVRIAVNEILTRKFHLPVDSPEEAFNIAYRITPLPYRNNHPDGSPKIDATLKYVVQMIVASVILIGAVALFGFVVMIATALILGGIAAIAGFFRR
jgi:hypothetical protein